MSRMSRKGNFKFIAKFVGSFSWPILQVLSTSSAPASALEIISMKSGLFFHVDRANVCVQWFCENVIA